MAAAILIIGIILMLVLFVFVVIMCTLYETFNIGIKDVLNEYIKELKYRQKKKYGPEYSLEYKIDKIEKENGAATVYCVYSEKFSKNDIVKERNEIIYMIQKK